jgi:Uma2 family endonuclease
MTTTELAPTYEVVQLFPRQGEWTEESYHALPAANRILELSDGKLVVPPMPTPEHQDIVLNIAVALRVFVRAHKLGKVAVAPLPVRLWAGKVREPDVLVLLAANLHHIQPQWWDALDLAVEVVSPGTQKADREEKRHEYAQAGVREYWLVEPGARTVAVYTLAGDAYTLAATYREGMAIESRVLAGLVLPVADVFAEE